MNYLLKLFLIALIGLGCTSVIHSMFGASTHSGQTAFAEWTKEEQATFRLNCHDKYNKDNGSNGNGNNGNGQGNQGESTSSDIDTNKYCDCMADAMQTNNYGPNDLAKASKELYADVSQCLLSTIE